MTKKNFTTIICLICLIEATTFPAKAFESITRNSDATSVPSVIQLENGNYLIKTVPKVDFAQRGSVTGHTTFEFVNSNGVVQWTATLTGSFTYNGSTASCTSSSCITSVQSGNWSETYNHAYPSGATAAADITMVRKVLFITVQTETAHLTLTCDANGHLS